MNIFTALKNLFTTDVEEESVGKTMTAEAWKRGLLIGDYLGDEGAKNPFKDSSLVYVAASKISENLPQAPLQFYNIQTGQQLGIDSPVVKLFKLPNQRDTYFTFFETSTLYLALFGETFIYMGESMGQAAGTSTLPGYMQVLLPPSMKANLDDMGIPKSWNYDTGKTTVIIPADQILQIKFPNPYNPVRGLSPLVSAKQEIDSDYLAGKFSSSFFRNGANPGTVFTIPEDDESTDEQRKAFIKEWNALHKGASKQYKSAILNPGMDAKKVGLTQEEMDYVKQRNFNTERVLSVLGVPPPMAGFYEQATYGNVRTAKRIFWNETIKAYARRYESALNNFFLPKYAPGTSCKFNFSDIDELKHDAVETSTLVNIYANHGIPMNVLIEAFELPFGPQEGLDQGYQPMTMLPVGTTFLDTVNNQGGDSKMIDVTPSAFLGDELRAVKQIRHVTKENLEKQQLLDTFSKNLHNYFYRQREKLLKSIANDNFDENTFWKQENDRLINKFEEIYEKYNKNSKNLVSINNFNKKMINKILSCEKDEIPDKIRELYNSFDKTIGSMKKSRVFAISEIEIAQFSEQITTGDIKNEI
jgi:HK97 family phage portal protein